MGKRYEAILNFLDVNYMSIDVNTPQLYREFALTNADHVIVATPTIVHIENILESLEYGKKKRFLCEKPVTQNLDLFDILREIDFTMQFQYSELVKPNHKGHSFYDYFRHGSDGLVWDCMQVIALAKDTITLSEKSPIWKCAINGQVLSLSDMDLAYINYVRKWLSGYKSDLHEIIEIHQKVKQHEERFNKSFNWNSGTVNK